MRIKYDTDTTVKSQPSWAAWIEIPTCAGFFEDRLGRSPLGLRGLKLPVMEAANPVMWSRSPLGLRGLKYRGAVITTKS